MITSSKISRILIIISKVFLLGLLLQFVAQTFVTFRLGWDGTTWDIVWMWKEIVIVGLAGFAMYWLWTTKLWKTLFDTLGLKWFALCTIGIILFVLIISTFATHVGMGASILSLRYSILGFIIFLVFALLAWGFFDENTHLEKRYTKLFTWLLRGSLLWRLIIYFVPGLLQFLGYDKYSYEGDVGVAPPAVYYSQYNEGYVRNQFVFERPISRGFFLVAFRPLFFAIALKRRGWKKILLRGGLYTLAIISTFSRAAWLAWILQTGILILVEYRKHIKAIILYGGIPAVLIFGGLLYVGRHQILERQFSDIGHLRSVKEALVKIADHPFLGEGAGSAGPASHHLGPGKQYNPENQFLQIWIEYGFFGFLGWMAIYLWFHRVGIRALKEDTEHNPSKQKKYFGFLLFCFSLGIFGLSICGLVLHSFVDRMIVYPFMALFGITYSLYKKIH